MGKPQEDQADVQIIAESIIRFAEMSWEDYKAHIEAHPEDAWPSLTLPNRQGHRSMSGEASRAFFRLAKRHTSIDANSDAIDLQQLDHAIREAFVHYFLVQGKPWDEQKWIDLMLNRAMRAVKKEHLERTHYLPCVVIVEPTPESFLIGPVRFLTNEKFFLDYGHAIDVDIGGEALHGHAQLRQVSSPESAGEESDDRASRGDRIGLTWINDYYKAFTWIAEVEIPPCGSRVSEERAETSVQAALDVLKLFFGYRNGKDFRLGHHRGHRDRTAHLNRVNDRFDYILRSGGEGGFADDGWYDGIKAKNEWALQAAGSAIAAYLEPNKVMSDHRDRWLGALRWYGLAVTEPTPAAQLVQYVAALERLTVLEETGTTDDKSGQTVTDVVTRRTALLAWTSDNRADLPSLREEARTLYRWRSALLHGRSSPLTKEIVEVMHLAHRIAQQAMFNALAIYIQLDLANKRTPKDLEARFVELEALLERPEKEQS
jgi:hypothetical protein